MSHFEVAVGSGSAAAALHCRTQNVASGGGVAFSDEGLTQIAGDNVKRRLTASAKESI